MAPTRIVFSGKKKYIISQAFVSQKLAEITSIGGVLSDAFPQEISLINQEKDTCFTLKSKLHLVRAIQAKLYSKTLAI